jgi:hypothetical protein
VRHLSKCLYAIHDLLCRALNTIVVFAEHYAKRGTFGRTMRKAKDEENLSTLRTTLEEAFNRFKVCLISS